MGLSLYLPMWSTNGEPRISANPGAGAGHVHSKKGSFDRSTVSWQCSLNPQLKMGHFELNFRLFNIAFSRIVHI